MRQFQKQTQAVVCAAAGIALAACTINPSDQWNISGAVAPVPDGAEVLSIEADGLPAKGAVRARYLDNDQDEEYVLYRGDNGAQAEIIMAEASRYGFGAQPGDRRVLDFNKITKDTVGMWNYVRASNPNVGESFPHQGQVPFYVLPFTLAGGQNCVGFHSEFNHDVWDPEHGNFDNQLFGYYCALKGKSMTEADMRATVDRINVAGITAKAGPNKQLKAFGQLSNDPKLVAMVKQGAPGAVAGISKFPLDLVRIYGDTDGGGANEPN